MVKRKQKLGAVSAVFDDTNPANEQSLPVVLFVHGNSSSRKTFSQQLNDPMLSAHYRMIAVDLPGHGEAEASAPHYSLSMLGKFLQDFITSLDLRNIILVGHSLGGHAANALVRDGDADVRGLFLFQTTPVDDVTQLGEAFLPFEDSSQLFSSEVDRKRIKNLFRALLPGLWDVSSQVEDFCQTDPAFRAKIGAGLGEEKWSEIRALNETSIPLGIAHGELDPAINLKYLQALPLRYLWETAPQKISSAGHFPHVENPAAFNNQLVSFLSAVSQTHGLSAKDRVEGPGQGEANFSRV